MKLKGHTLSRVGLLCSSSPSWPSSSCQRPSFAGCRPMPGKTLTLRKAEHSHHHQGLAGGFKKLLIKPHLVCQADQTQHPCLGWFQSLYNYYQQNHRLINFKFADCRMKGLCKVNLLRFQVKILNKNFLQNQFWFINLKIQKV